MKNLRGIARSRMSVDAFADRLSRLMPVMMRNMVRQERNYFSQGLITLPQFRVLQLLVEGGPYPMADVARALGVTSPTVTGLIDRLVKMGLVRREDSREDRRVTRVGLTLKGRRVIEHIRNQRRNAIARTFGSISARERATYLEIVEKIVAQLTAGAFSRGHRQTEGANHGR